MRKHIDLNEVVHKLMKIARQSIKLDRVRWIEEERLHRGREYNLFQFLIEIEDSKQLLEEYGMINSSDLSPSTTEELHALASPLGRIANRANFTRDIMNRKLLGSYALSNLQATGATLSI